MIGTCLPIHCLQIKEAYLSHVVAYYHASMLQSGGESCIIIVLSLLQETSSSLELSNAAGTSACTDSVLN